MRRWPALIVLLFAGCTNAPLAGFLDAVNPSHLARDLQPTDRDQFRPNNDPLAPVVTPPPLAPVVTPLAPATRPLAPTAPPPPAPDNGFTPPSLAPITPSATPFSGPNG